MGAGEQRLDLLLIRRWQRDEARTFAACLRDIDAVDGDRMEVRIQPQAVTETLDPGEARAACIVLPDRGAQRFDCDRGA